MFSERGYTAVEIDIEAPKESASTRDSLQAMAKGERLVFASMRYLTDDKLITLILNLRLIPQQNSLNKFDS